MCPCSFELGWYWLEPSVTQHNRFLIANMEVVACAMHEVCIADACVEAMK